MTQTIHGIISYLIVGIMVMVVIYFRRPETFDEVKGLADLFPKPINIIVFYLLSALLVVLFPLVLLTQAIHILKHRRTGK